MSRAIKFRIWDKANKEYMILGATGLDARNGDVIDYYNEGNKLGGPEEYDVEQYTGLKDKNGKEIYEGDIIEWVNGLGEKHIFEIIWNECRASFQMVEIGQEYPYILQGLSDKMKPYCEVVGNIHEPPKDFRPEHLKRMGVSISKGGRE